MSHNTPIEQQTAIPRNALVQGDCLEIMAGWPQQSVDLIFADPPYNIGYSYDEYHDQRDDQEYIAWTEKWIDACARLLKPSGSLYILIGDEFAAETRVHLKKLERDGQLLFRNWIIWHYTFGQRCKLKYNRSHVHLFYCVGSGAISRHGRPRADLAKNPPFTFHYDQAAVPSARMTTYNDARTNPKGKLPDDTWYLKFPASKDWHIRPQEAMEQSPENLFAPDGDTWYQSRLCGTFKEREQWHPCQLPEALLERIINVSSNRGDLVFDPFAGSGTTLATAKKLGRDWLGTELSKEYQTNAIKRIEQTTLQTDDETDEQQSETTASAGSLF